MEVDLNDMSKQSLIDLVESLEINEQELLAEIADLKEWIKLQVK